jgi:DNA-binding transcriptional MerR regulator
VHDHPVDDDLLPIGMFSRASSLSIKTLRAYHESGILVPARVDPRTGYRSYTVDQLADAAIVQRLRRLDLPLEQVRAVLEARDPETTRRVLGEHRQEMQLRLEETERIVAELQSVVAPTTHTPVHLRTEAATQSVRITGLVEPDDFGDWLAWAYGELGAFLDRRGVAPSGAPGALYAAELADDGPETAEAFLPVAAPVVVPARERHVAVGEVPAARVAVLVHAGDYDTIGDTYRTLGAWVARHAQHAGERVREWYVIGPLDAADPSEYRTEISWPIRTATSPTEGAPS